jgi:polar amino acid transport system permease protein
MYQWDFYTVLQSFDLFVIGLWVTFLYTIGSISMGIVIGLLTCYARMSSSILLRTIAKTYQEIFRCTPLLVQIMWAYYALPLITGYSISNSTAGLLTLSLYVGSFYAEIFRGGVNAVDKGQTEAALSTGMSKFQSMQFVIFPQAIKKMLPAFINQSVIQVKNTSLLYAISIGELTYMTSVINSETYRPMEAYSLAAVMYFLMLYPLTKFADHVERKLGKSD